MEVDDLAPYEKDINPGHGLILSDDTQIQLARSLFNSNPVWSVADLESEVGRNASQAVFNLRRAGMRILTVQIKGTRCYLYQYVKPDNPFIPMRADGSLLPIEKIRITHDSRIWTKAGETVSEQTYV